MQRDVGPGPAPRGADWHRVTSGESGDRVFRSRDGLTHAKTTGRGNRTALAGERDRLAWLAARDIAAPRVLAWEETDDGACLVMTSVPGRAASDLPAGDLMTAWPSIVAQIGALHALPVPDCPFDRGLARMHRRAMDVVARGALNPDFLPDADRTVPARELLARIDAELPERLAQEPGDRVVCHGDPCLPNLMVDPETLSCTGVIDLGRLGTADRYADLALIVANARESLADESTHERAVAMLFAGLGLARPDRDRLAFYLRLDPLTWG